MQKWLSSIILNECKYDELSLVLTESYTKIYQNVLRQKMKLFLIAIACFIVALGGGIAAIVFYQQAGGMQNTSIVFIVASGASVIAGGVLMYIRVRTKMPHIHTVSKLHWRYESFPFDVDMTCLCDTRKAEERAETLSLFELPIPDISGKLNQINSNIQTLNEEADYLQASADIRNNIQGVEQRSISSPFIAINAPIYEELSKLSEKMDVLQTSSLHVLPAKAQGLDDIGQVIEDCRKFALDRTAYDEFLRTSNTIIEEHAQNAYKSIDVAWPIKKPDITSELAMKIDKQVVELGGFEVIQSSTSEMFDTTLETLEEDIKPEIDRVNDERYRKIDMAEDKCNTQIEQIEMNRDMQIQTHESRIDSLESQISGIRAQIDGYRDQIRGLERSKQSKQSAPYDATEQMKKQIDAQNRQIEQMNRGIDKQIRSVERQISGLRDQVSNLNSQISSIQSQISQVNQQADDQIASAEAIRDSEVNAANAMAKAQIQELRAHIEELTQQQQQIEEFIKRNYESIEFDSTISNIVTPMSLPNQLIVEYRHKAVSQIAQEIKELNEQLLDKLHQTTDLIAKYRIESGPFSQNEHAEYFVPVWYILYTEADNEEQKCLAYTPSRVQINQDKKVPCTFTQLPALHDIYANEVEDNDTSLMKAIQKATITELSQTIKEQLEQLKSNKSLGRGVLKTIMSNFKQR